MRLANAWHWFTTSRYTRELEAQRDTLLARVDRLERENLTLMIQVYPRLGLKPEEVQKQAVTKENMSAGRRR